MEAEKVRALLAISPGKLGEAAKQIEMPLPLAREMRVQALNLILGRCVLCEKYAPMGLCASCRRENRGKPILRTTRERVLRRLDPKAVLIRRACLTCTNEFTQTVDSVIRNLLNFGRPRISRNCRKCKKEKREMRALHNAELRKAKSNPKPVHSGHLPNNPFADSKMLADMRPNLCEKESPEKQLKK